MMGVRMPLVAVLLSSLGCMTLQPLNEPAESIPKANPKVVYVTYKNRSIMGVAEPRVSGDSLFGLVQGQSNRPLAVPLSQVERIEAILPDGKRTTLLVAGLAAATGVVVYALVKAIGGRGGSCSPFDDMPEDC